MGEWYDKYRANPSERKAPEKKRVGERIVEEFIRQRESVGVTEPLQEFYKNVNERDFFKEPVYKDVGWFVKEEGKAVMNTVNELFQRGNTALGGSTLSLLRDKSAAKAFKEFYKGVTGQSLSTTGDIPRTYLYGKVDPTLVELAAGTTDFVTMVGLAKFAGWLKAGAKVHGEKWMVKQAKDAYNSVEKALSDVGAKYNKAFNTIPKAAKARSFYMKPKPVGMNEVPVKDVVKSMKDIPKALFKEFIEPNIKGKEFVTVNDLRWMKTNIGKQAGDPAWIRAAQSRGVSVSKGHIMEASRNLKKMIINNVDDETAKIVRKIDPLWEQLVTKGKKLQRTVYDYSSKSFKTRKLLSDFKSTYAAGTRDMYKDLMKYAKDFRSTYKELSRFAFREKAKQVAVPAAKIGAIGALGVGGYQLVEAIKRLTE